jgi:hypothetical protein
MVGRLEVSDLEAEVLRAEIFLCAERHWEGDPTQGVGHLLRNASDLSWLSGGDFNEILHDSEQIGGLDHAKWQMEGFRNAIEQCGFTDLGYSGLPYTWDNKRDGMSNIKVRLDRCLADDRMLDIYGNSTVAHLQTTESDHCALLITLRRSGGVGTQRRSKPFRYENMWQRHEVYEETVASAWMGGCSSLNDVHSSLGGDAKNSEIMGGYTFRIGPKGSCQPSASPGNYSGLQSVSWALQ